MTELVCMGLDGTDPVTVLATLGLLGTIQHLDASVLLSWQLNSGWRPVLTTKLDQAAVNIAVVEALVGSQAADGRERLEELKSQLEEMQKRARLVTAAGCDDTDKFAKKAMKVQVAELKAMMSELKTAIKAKEANLEDCIRGVTERHPITAVAKHLDDYVSEGLSRLQLRDLWHQKQPWYLPGLACDVDLVGKKTIIARTIFSFANNNSGKQLIKDFATLAALTTQTRVDESVFGFGTAEYPITGLGWDPASQKSYALQAADPQSDVRCRPVHHALAFLGLGMLPVVPVGNNRATTGISSIRITGSATLDSNEDEGGVPRQSRASDHWSWPLWTTPLTPTVVKSLLACAAIQDPVPDVQALRAMGIAEVRRARRFSLNKRSYFTPSTPVA